jgi:chemotaxis protein histidine kinase CheA
MEPHPLGAADFFALEAGECLDRLETLVTSAATPSGDELLRLARVLRGSALMANKTPIARAAAALEGVARAQRDHRKSWDAAMRERVAQSVEEFRRLVRQSRQWTEADSDRANRLAHELDALVGTPQSQIPTHAADSRADLATGVRAFVAREGALIASALDRAARALRSSPGDREPLYNVLRRMQSLRGLAELGELAPLPDILDGIELAVGDLTRLFAPPPGVDQVLEAAGQALTRISRDVADHGKPDRDAPEAQHFTELLLRAFAVERDVVAIETLYVEGDPEPFTKPSSQPQFAAPEPLGPLELVSHGEHLCQSADLIATARSGTERDLRLYHLLGALRSAAAPSADPVAGALGIFARSAQEALAAGVASHSVDHLVERMREAGELLRKVVETDDRMQVSRRLLDVAHRLDRLRAGPPEDGATATGPDEPVPIESLAFDAEPEIIPIESLAPDPGEPATALESSFRTYHRLLRERAPTRPSIDVLLGKPAPAAAPAAAPEPVTPAPEEPPPVEIDALCYRGHAALERAVAVRHELKAQLTRDASLESLQPLLQELLDLVPRALGDS